jgi:hypothetical protein
MPARRFLDFLELEHMHHGGAENGRLLAPYSQLEAFGISSRDISPAIEMVLAFGFVARTVHGERNGGRANASRYRLTWLPTAEGDLPTEDYKRVTEADVRAFLDERRHLRRCKRARRSGP